MAFDNPENPTIMEDLISSLGATPVKYALRNECCGGYTTLGNKQIVIDRANAVLENAAKNGVEMIITACPLCLYNLKKNGTKFDIPVKYFTEVLAEALGLIEE